MTDCSLLVTQLPTNFLLMSHCLKLLNEKNDDEDEGARADLKKRNNELLQQLLKDQDDERKVQEQQVGSHKLSLQIKDNTPCYMQLFVILFNHR